MNQFQLILLLLALVIFAIFFKQLFSGNHPKRGIDFESKIANDTIGGVSRPDKIFKKVEYQNQSKDRTQELLNIAKDALLKNDKSEAKKALQTILIREPDNIEALRVLGTIDLEENNLEDAKARFEKILEYSSSDDLTHNHLANTLHKLGIDDEAIRHHKIAIKLDENYAPYYFNYANTLYDLGQTKEALSLYKKALELDPSLKDAKKIVSEIENERD